MANAKPTALLSNDDGIDSFFLKTLAHTLSASFDVTVAAPLAQQSWIGKAISRNKTVHLAKATGYPYPAWTLDGTPCDCVNIALGHLLEQPADIVISGINITSNLSVPLILSSGTFGAAVEGISWGIPSIAASMRIPSEISSEVEAVHGNYSPELTASVAAASRHIERIAHDYIEASRSDSEVLNLNFPFETSDTTPVINCKPAHNVHPGSLFVRESESSFRFELPKTLCGDFEKRYKAAFSEETDWSVTYSGKIAHSVIDFGLITKSPARAAEPQPAAPSHG